MSKLGKCLGSKPSIKDSSLKDQVNINNEWMNEISLSYIKKHKESTRPIHQKLKNSDKGNWRCFKEMQRYVIFLDEKY